MNPSLNPTDLPENAVNSEALTTDEKILIAALRAGDTSAAADQVVAMLGKQSLPKPAPVAPVEKEQDIIPRGTTGYVPMRMTRQFAAFMFGYMALSGSLTKNQMEDSEEIEWLIDDLTKGIDLGVKLWTFGGFCDLQDLYNAADVGEDELRRRESKKKDGAE